MSRSLLIAPLVLVLGWIGSPAAAAEPATCLPHCDNTLYPYTEFARAYAETLLPVGPPAG